MTAGGTKLKVAVPLDGTPSAESVLEQLEWLRDVPAVELLLFQAVVRGKDLSHPPRGLGEPPSRQVGVYDHTGALLPIPGTGPFGGRELLEQEELRVIREAEAYLWAVARQLRGVQAAVSVSLADNVAKAIVEMARAEGVSFIAMTRRSRNILSRLVRASMADKVAKRTDVPVFVYRVN